MKGYRKPTGIYIELSDDTPVSEALFEVALRPSLGHVFTDTWDTDPMNPSLCWRLKTNAETNTARDEELQSFLDSAGGKIVKAVVQMGIDKGFWTLAELRAKYRSL